VVLAAIVRRQVIDRDAATKLPPPPGPDYLMDNIILPTSGRGVRAANSCTPFHSGHLGQHRLPRQGKFCW